MAVSDDDMVEFHANCAGELALSIIADELKEALADLSELPPGSRVDWLVKSIESSLEKARAVLQITRPNADF